ncbi:hypothetical protein DLJ53_17740 [Acuticoccus sediminis]|uniref:Uncharacterized protein n=1 Tax=Acuticoccus sediminis TaxID=2184697 RepID=A0A8B2NSM9_9HYPH|nr:hypothetical protein [Acuticoccus sediminis]RAI01059.1 hypothetical protein DLJ53_17740 [Acuticoccus sediminis]
MPIIKLLARLLGVFGRLLYYVAREFFGLVAAVLGVVLAARGLIDIAGWRADQETLTNLALGLPLIGFGLALQWRRARG